MDKVERKADVMSGNADIENKCNSFPQDIRRTKQREEIFRILSEETKPVSASDIYNRLAYTVQEANFAISTVYRALLVFEEKGYVVKSTITGSDMAYYEWNAGTHRHFARCLHCRRIVPMSRCPLEHMFIESSDFKVTGHKLELFGYCTNCQSLYPEECF